jgi:conjugal transfer ATP-binding protein TraC
VLELEELKGRKHLQRVVLLSLIFSIQHQMYLGDRAQRKMVVIDEAWDLLGEGVAANFIESGYRRFRKYNGLAVTITQGVNDLQGSKTGKAIEENSANKYLLAQKPEAITAIQKAGMLPLSDYGYKLLRRVHTVKGMYSEIMFMTDYGTGIGRLVVDDFQKLLFTTDPNDIAAIEQKKRQGLGTVDAINQVLADRGQLTAA